jgi:hypothetical protein
MDRLSLNGLLALPRRWLRATRDAGGVGRSYGVHKPNTLYISSSIYNQLRFCPDMSEEFNSIRPTTAKRQKRTK